MAIKAGGGALGGSGIPRVGKWGSGGAAGGGFGSGIWQGEQGFPVARPIAPSAGSWGPVGAATFADCLKEAVPDEDNTYIESGITSDLDAIVTIREFGGLSLIPDNKFQLVARARKSAASGYVNGIEVRVYKGIATALGTLIAVLVIPQASISNAGYLDFTYTLSAAEGADFKTAGQHSIFFRAGAANSNTYRVTQTYIKRLP